MTKTGDTYFTNEMVDNVLVSNDGWLGDAAKLYANGHDLKDPMLSPVYGDFQGFPPSILTSGTRSVPQQHGACASQDAGSRCGCGIRGLRRPVARAVPS